MSWVLAPVEGLWGVQAPLGRQGHPIPWAEVQTEVSPVGALPWGSDSQAPTWGCAWGHGSLLWKTHLFPLG